MDKGLLASATSSDDSPTPGYMLNEIARSTLNNYTANVQLQEFLLNRLTKDNHNIKFKCLVIIKHVCRSGRAEFKKEMSRNVGPIKECLQYRGPPDPLRGDENYRRVRDTAKDALDAIFDSQMPVTTSAVAAGNRIQGMGNDFVPEGQTTGGNNKGASRFLNGVVTSIGSSIYGDGTDAKYAGHPGATSNFNGENHAPTPSTSQNMQGSYHGPSYNNAAGPAVSAGYNSNAPGNNNAMRGIGNPNFKDPREEKSWLQKASEAAKSSSTINAISSSIASSIPYLNSNSDANQALKDQNYPGYTSNRGPNAIGGTTHGYNPNAPYNNGTTTTPSPTVSATPMNAFAQRGNNQTWQQRADNTATSPVSTSPKGEKVVDFADGPSGARAGAAENSGAYEKSMIDALCEPGGLKPVPPDDKLQQFLQNANTLSVDIVGDCLLDVLNSEEWQSRTKALIVIAQLVKLKETTVYFDWWSEQVEEIRALLSDSKSGVRVQASKTLKLLDVDSGTSSAGVVGATRRTKATSASSQHNAAVSLLDMDDGSNSSPTPFTTPVTTTNINTAVVDITTAAEPSTTGNSDHDLFSGMSIGNSATQAMTAPPLPPPPPPSMTTSVDNKKLDMFDLMMVPSAPTPNAVPPVLPPAIPTDLFGNMTLSAAPTSVPTLAPTNGIVNYQQTTSSNTNTQTGFQFVNTATVTSSNIRSTSSEEAASAFGFVNNTSNSAKTGTKLPSSKLIPDPDLVIGTNPPSTADPFGFLAIPGSTTNTNTNNHTVRASAVNMHPNSILQTITSPPIPLPPQPLLGMPGPTPMPGIPPHLNLTRPPGMTPQQQQMYMQQQQQMRYAPPPHQMHGGAPHIHTQMPQQMHTAMLNPLAPRKDIPTDPGATGGTGFAFMGDGAQAQNDSFSFVTDLMKK